MRRLSPRLVFPLVIALLLVLPAAVKESGPVVGLNHLSLVPDSATYAAIASSAFLRDTFALVDQSSDEGAERIALFGRSTYVEFRPPGNDGPGWTSGLALGTDERGGLLALANRLTSEVGPLRFDSLSRRRGSADVPWLYQLAAREGRADSALAVRIVEYHPHFVRRWFGPTASNPKSVARADVLAMHATKVGTARRPLVDVIAIKVAASPESGERLMAHCRGVGWRVQPTTAGHACVGSGVRMFVVPAKSHERGIVAFTMRVAPNTMLRGSLTRRFGRSALRVSKNGLATWEFSSPTP
jgi:hypothetical protein